MLDAKEYLEQARFLDMRINAKLAQLDSLHQLMLKIHPTDDVSLRGTQCRGNLLTCTALADAQKPADNCHCETSSQTGCGNPFSSSAAAAKILSLQSNINRDIDSLVNLKDEITRRIGQLSKPEYQTVLELRYLCFWSWEKIAVNMHYHQLYIYELHRAALKEFSEVLQRP
jgi:hypothetical protein